MLNLQRMSLFVAVVDSGSFTAVMIHQRYDKNRERTEENGI